MSRSSNARLSALLLLAKPVATLFLLSASGCALAENGEEVQPAVPNDPSNVLAEGYQPKSKAERERARQIGETTADFQKEALGLGAGRESALTASFGEAGAIPQAGWWSREPFSQVLEGPRKVAAVGLEEVYQSALANSSQIRVFASLPLIRETAIDEAEGVFDPEIFSQWRYDNTSEPTSTSLETGQVNDFFRERGWAFQGGIRKRFLTGATVGLVQEAGARANNSQFFIPSQQGRAALRLSVMQPLLRGSGVSYNRTLMQIAKLDAETGYDEFIRQLETHLMEVNRTYWSLYLARAVYLDKQRLVRITRAVVDELSERGNLDTIDSQLSRARGALATRRSDLVRSELAIRNAESRLRALLNDPSFVEQGIGEVIPGDLPVAVPVPTDFPGSVKDSLAYRPEIKQAERHLKAAGLREGMARNEKRPSVNAVGEVGLSSLQGAGDYSAAFNDQLNDREPTWGFGLVASVPLERQSAKAVHLRTQLELRQKADQLRSVLDTVLLEVQIAHREVETAWPDVVSKWEAAVAADQELAVLMERRKVDVDGAGTSTSLYLENLLDAQLRGAMAREEFLRALVVYNSALTNLERAKGTLLQSEDVEVLRTAEGGERTRTALPVIRAVHDEAAAHAVATYALQQ
jgi:outer membrane protein TolC